MEPYTEPEPTEAPTAPASPPPPNFGPGFKPVALLWGPGHEPAPQATDDDGQAAWVAATALWHPALLAKSESLPRIEDAVAPSAPEARDVRLVASNSGTRLPLDHRTVAEEIGVVLVDAGRERSATTAALLERAGLGDTVFTPEQTEIIADFLALGAARWWLGELTIAMGHPDGLDHEALTRETLQSARAWAEGDANGARNRLRAAFEVMTQARERFYPVDAYLVDLCLLDPAGRSEELGESLAAHSAFTLFCPAKAIESIAGRDPDTIAALRTAVDEGWADVIGGAYAEADEPLLPVASILWQFRKGSDVYRTHLDGRNVETVARRRFGLYPQLPQVAKRFGFRFALHLGFDAGKFPIRAEMKRLWDAPDGTSLETLNRPPIAADRGVEALRLPWRIARSMKDDFNAMIAVVHWAGRVDGWFSDLRRALKHSPTLMRLTTVNDFFHLTDRPFESFRFGIDDYIFPYLDQALRRGDPRPISARAEHARLRAQFDAVEATQALARALGQDPSEAAVASSTLEESIESGRFAEAVAQLADSEALWSRALTRGIVGDGGNGPAGYLVINPVGIARRVAVILPDAADDLQAPGPLRAAQLTEEGVQAVIDLAAFGYAWIPRANPASAPSSPPEHLAIRDRTLSNAIMSVSLDPNSGGIRGVSGTNEPTARLGQQLVIAGLSGSDGKSAPSAMKGTGFEADYGGPALVQATATGTIHHPADGSRLASFTQRYRIWTGRPTLEIDVTLTDLDASWLQSIARADPWSNYLACRWAWPDPESSLRRTSLLAPEPTTADRPETPDAIDILSRRRRTSLLFGGLAHHKRVGTRMLDTILVAGEEEGHSFRLGVAIDLEHPWQAAIDGLAPAFVVPTDAGPPKTGPAGWLLTVDTKAVAVVKLAFLDRSGDGRGWGLDLTLLETAGRSTRCKVRTFRDPVWARQLDFNDETIVDLPTDGDSVLVDLTPHELARVDITLG
jgi:alpha-mannosidase